jgi:hypothetical protein
MQHIHRYAVTRIEATQHQYRWHRQQYPKHRLLIKNDSQHAFAIIARATVRNAEIISISTPLPPYGVHLVDLGLHTAEISL